MKVLVRVLAIGIALLVLACYPGGSGANESVPYRLRPESEFETGCFDPCACPVLMRGPVDGTFLLVLDHEDGVNRYYAVDDVHWKFESGGTPVAVTGSGTYRLGGEVALTHRLQIDLSVGGGPPQHFDSGDVTPPSDFPKIDIDVALHGFFCHDSALFVHAAPAEPADVPGPGARLALTAGPNPFGAEVRLTVVLHEAGLVTVAVIDPAGRIVRRLADRHWLASGAHAFAWNGRGENGRSVPAGLYFASVRAGGRAERRTLVKLD